MSRPGRSRPFDDPAALGAAEEPLGGSRWHGAFADADDDARPGSPVAGPPLERGRVAAADDPSWGSVDAVSLAGPSSSLTDPPPLRERFLRTTNRVAAAAPAPAPAPAAAPVPDDLAVEDLEPAPVDADVDLEEVKAAPSRSPTVDTKKQNRVEEAETKAEEEQEEEENDDVSPLPQLKGHKRDDMGERCPDCSRPYNVSPQSSALPCMCSVARRMTNVSRNPFVGGAPAEPLSHEPQTAPAAEPASPGKRGLSRLLSRSRSDTEDDDEPKPKPKPAKPGIARQLSNMVSIGRTADSSDGEADDTKKPETGLWLPPEFFDHRTTEFRFTRHNVLQAIVSVYCILSVPFLCAFGERLVEPYVTIWLVSNAVSDAATLVLIAWRAQLSVQSGRKYFVRRPLKSESDDTYMPEPLVPRVASHAMYWRLRDVRWVELPSALPLDWVCLAAGAVSTGGSVGLLRLLKLLRIARLAEIMWHVTSDRVDVNLTRLGKSLGLVLLITHWVGCLWFVVSEGVGYVQRSDDLWTEGDVRHLYLVAFYWAYTQTIKAPTDRAIEALDEVNGEELVVSMGSMIFGVFIFVVLVGQVSSAIASLDRAEREYRDNVESIKQFCRKNNVPEPLRQRMLRHMGFVQAQRSNDQVLSLLSSAIHKEVILHTCSDLVKSVPFFSGHGQNFLFSVLLYLHHEYYSPEDVLVWEGEIPLGMWFVSRGRLLVCRHGVENANEEVAITVLETGSYFGEIALLSTVDKTMPNKATATVRALTFCDLYFLSKQDFKNIIVEYPKVVDAMRTLANERTRGALRSMQKVVKFSRNLKAAMMMRKKKKKSSDGSEAEDDAPATGLAGVMARAKKRAAEKEAAAAKEAKPAAAAKVAAAPAKVVVPEFAPPAAADSKESGGGGGLRQQQQLDWLVAQVAQMQQSMAKVDALAARVEKLERAQPDSQLDADAVAQLENSQRPTMDAASQLLGELGVM